MARRTLSDLRDTAENAAWREYGKRNFAWIIGWRLLKVPLLLAVILIPAGLLVRWIARSLGDVGAESLPNAPDSVGPWPWLLLAVSAATGTALAGYRWATPFRGGKSLIAGIVVCFALSALAILWARAAY